MDGIQNAGGVGGPKWVPPSNTEGLSPTASGRCDFRNLVGLPSAQFFEEFMRKLLDEKLLEEVLALMAEGMLAQISPESLQNGLANLDALLDKLPPEVAAKVRSEINKFLLEVASSADVGQLPGMEGLQSTMQEALMDSGLQPDQTETLTAGLQALYVVALAAWKADPAGLREALAAGDGGPRRVGPDPSTRV